MRMLSETVADFAMIPLGLWFIFVGLHKETRYRGAFSQSLGTPAHWFHRVIFLIAGISVAIPGVLRLTH